MLSSQSDSISWRILALEDISPLPGISALGGDSRWAPQTTAGDSIASGAFSNVWRAPTSDQRALMPTGRTPTLQPQLRGAQSQLRPQQQEPQWLPQVRPQLRPQPQGVQPQPQLRPYPWGPQLVQREPFETSSAQALHFNFDSAGNRSMGEPDVGLNEIAEFANLSMSDNDAGAVERANGGNTGTGGFGVLPRSPDLWAAPGSRDGNVRVDPFQNLGTSGFGAPFSLQDPFAAFGSGGGNVGAASHQSPVTGGFGVPVGFQDPFAAFGAGGGNVGAASHHSPAIGGFGVPAGFQDPFAAFGAGGGNARPDLSQTPSTSRFNDFYEFQDAEERLGAVSGDIEVDPFGSDFLETGTMAAEDFFGPGNIHPDGQLGGSLSTPHVPADDILRAQQEADAVAIATAATAAAVAATAAGQLQEAILPNPFDPNNNRVYRAPATSGFDGFYVNPNRIADRPESQFPPDYNTYRLSRDIVVRMSKLRPRSSSPIPQYPYSYEHALRISTPCPGFDNLSTQKALQEEQNHLARACSPTRSPTHDPARDDQAPPDSSQRTGISNQGPSERHRSPSPSRLDQEYDTPPTSSPRPRDRRDLN